MFLLQYNDSQVCKDNKNKENCKQKWENPFLYQEFDTFLLLHFAFVVITISSSSNSSSGAHTRSAPAEHHC